MVGNQNHIRLYKFIYGLFSKAQVDDTIFVKGESMKRQYYSEGENILGQYVYALMEVNEDGTPKFIRRAKKEEIKQPSIERE